MQTLQDSPRYATCATQWEYFSCSLAQPRKLVTHVFTPPPNFKKHGEPILRGELTTWNAGAERIKGYKAGEIIGQHFSRFYTENAIDRADNGGRRRTAPGSMRLAIVSQTLVTAKQAAQKRVTTYLTQNFGLRARRVEIHLRLHDAVDHRLRVAVVGRRDSRGQDKFTNPDRLRVLPCTLNASSHPSSWRCGYRDRSAIAIPRC